MGEEGGGGGDVGHRLGNLVLHVRIYIKHAKKARCGGVLGLQGREKVWQREVWQTCIIKTASTPVIMRTAAQKRWGGVSGGVWGGGLGAGREGRDRPASSRVRSRSQGEFAGVRA